MTFSRRPRRRDWTDWLPVLAGWLALLVARGGPVPPRAPQPLAWPAATATRALELAADSAPAPPRRVRVERYRIIHRPVRPVSARSQPQRRPQVPARSPSSPPPARDPLAEALARLDRGPHRVVVGDAAVVLTTTEPDLSVAGPVLWLGSCAQAPDGDGWRALAAEDRLQADAEVSEWWSIHCLTRPRMRPTAGGGVVLWLPVGVRAGWEARHPAALRYWRRLVADERWRAAKSEDWELAGESVNLWKGGWTP